MRLILCSLAVVFFGGPVCAHEVNPAYLAVTEVAPEQFAIVWKQPVKGGRRLRLVPQFPPVCENGPGSVEIVPAARVERWTINCPLDTGMIGVAGLERTLTDVLLVLERNGHKPVHVVLRPASPAFALGKDKAPAMPTYLVIGIEHILSGHDHLLFVVGLCLAVPYRRIWLVITAFTLAHSCTLALVVLTPVSVPGPPVEAVIALGIVVLARQVARGPPVNQVLSATDRWPAAVAFGFGLIHGLGFAGALGDIGLPDNARVSALVLFNIGVEIGQLLFVMAILACGYLFVRLMRVRQDRLARLVAYCIGVPATFLVIERVTQF